MKKDILVDTGVYTYKMGEERNACRSTKAHNTVEIDGMNNAEIWSAFRVAKRGHARLRIITDTPKQIHLIGNSDGYEK